MFEAVHGVVAEGVATYHSQPRHQWVLQATGMVVLVVTGIAWTQAVEAALRAGSGSGGGGGVAAAVKACEAECTQQLMQASS
jgi:hypothetical protein